MEACRYGGSAAGVMGFLLVAPLFLPVAARANQMETVASPPAPPVWASTGRVEGHLALKFSSDGAFSGSLLAVVAENEILLVNLENGSINKVIKPRLAGASELEIHSASFLAPKQLFALANGLLRAKGKPPMPTPLLGFRWDIEHDQLVGEAHAIGPKGGFSPARYFPLIGYLALYKEGTFALWNVRTNVTGSIQIPGLAQIPNLYEFSPDGRWLVLAQIQTASGADPSVVELKTHKFVDLLAGHQGTVLSVAFSRDARKVVTACADGKVRVYSTADWKLLETMPGHQGAVHRAEFSPGGEWVASAGEDHTVRVWSAEDGALLRTFEESREPLWDVAFSPDGRFLAASSESTVLIWKQQ